jgi:hypothetical protein
MAPKTGVNYHIFGHRTFETLYFIEHSKVMTNKESKQVKW